MDIRHHHAYTEHKIMEEGHVGLVASTRYSGTIS